MRTNSLAIPIAIIIAAALIAGALIITGTKEPLTVDDLQKEEVADITIRPVDISDHILGNPNAPIMLVEYSDFDCPYCKQFHETLTRILSDYGAEGQVAWVYRHFPIPQLHPNAPTLAEASECVADLGGNDAFWTFADLVFGEREINAQTDITRLTEFAGTAGVDVASFESCLAAGEHANRIAQDTQEAVASGAQGTPHTVVLLNGKYQGVIGGAQPYANVKQIIETVRTQLR